MLHGRDAIDEGWRQGRVPRAGSQGESARSFHAVFINANVRFRFGRLESLVVTPRFHHWHHSAEIEARDRNFAVHLPWIDRLFGTYYCPPDRWPAAYGLGTDRIPDGYWWHLTWPFRRRRTDPAFGRGQ